VLENKTIRVFVIGFTARRSNQIKKTSYAQTSQIRQIRKKMFEIITREVTTSALKEVVAKFIPESISNQIIKECQGVYPLNNVFIRKVKVLKAPKFDTHKLLELHGDSTSEDKGSKVAEQPAAPVGEETA